MSLGNDGMGDLILTVNKIQDACALTGIDLQLDIPQIAVIGSQSVGKSSVLENFVGRDFLPRGSGIVTRRPLILQLINGPTEYGEFAHTDKKFSNFAEIRGEIERETDRETGTNKGISKFPITLRIYSPKVLNLTLVDLPGITKVPVGDQPPDIETQIREMILEHIEKETCLILAVSSATTDLSNSDALKLAREVDPLGQRTIGVITQLDLMDDGTDARDIFDGKLLSLRHGYIGVVNRSQKDIKNDKNIVAAMKNEREFFTNHESYRDIAHRLGTPYLQKVLNQKLMEHIRDLLPQLRNKLIKRMSLYEENIKKHEQIYPQDPLAKGKVLRETIRQLQSDFKREIGSLDSDFVETNRLTSGAKIGLIFHERFPNDISKVRFNEDKSIMDTKYAIKNLYGIEINLYAPFKAFQVMVRKQITQLEDPIINSIDLVVEELSKAVQICTQRLNTYPKFRECIENHIFSYIHGNRQPFQQNILSLIRMESAYMNTNHAELKMDQKTQSDGTQNAAIHNVPENTVIREGLLRIKIKNGDLRPFWTSLRPKTLTFIRHIYDEPQHSSDQLEDCIKLSLIGLKLHEHKHNSKSQNTIVLFQSNGKNVYRDFKELELLCESADEYQLWKDLISSCISKCESKKSDTRTSKLSSFEEDVLDICKKVDAYMNIVKETTRHMVPKAITLYIIRELENFINNDLLTTITSDSNEKYLEMLGVGEKDFTQYETMKKTYEACKEALNVIRMY